ncbi:hypothetical protein [Kibdelosporangium aridum]|uniref:hypothetical protein n=1 Tax=Kibdelosporangium aridum TaxID=2030 RepID=UPI0035E7A7E6
MARYLFHRLWQSALTLVLASIIVFIGVRALPGDPALAMAGEEADPATVAAVRAELGLDESLVSQYFKFAGNTLSGDFGESVRDRHPGQRAARRYLAGDHPARDLRDAHRDAARTGRGRRRRGVPRSLA